MYRFLRRSNALVLALLALVSACGDGPTEPRHNPQLDPGQAAPFQRVLVRDLPDGYATEGGTVDIGGTPAPLMYDSVFSAWSFAVPFLPAQEGVDVTFSRKGGTPIVLKLDIQPAPLAGGTPEAQIARVEARVDSINSTLAALSLQTSPGEDSVFVALVQGIAEGAYTLQQRVDALTTSEKAVVAAFYASTGLDKALSDILILLRDFEEPRVLYGPSSGTAAAQASFESPREIIQTCEKKLDRIELLGDVTSALGWAATVLQVGAIFTGGTTGVIGGFLDLVSVVGEFASILMNLDAFLPADGGLEVAAQPGQLQDGSRGRMALQLMMASPRSITRSAIEYRASQAQKEAAEKFIDMRVKAQTVRANVGKALLKQVVAGVVSDAITRLLDYVDPPFLREWGYTQVTGEGLSFTSDRSDAFRTVASQSTSDPYPLFDVPGGARPGMARIRAVAGVGGAPEQCQVRTDNAKAGLNSFEVVNTMIAELSFRSSAPVADTIRQNDYIYVDLPIQNNGRHGAQSVRATVGEVRGDSIVPWMSPVGIAASAYGSYWSLGPSSTGTVRLRVRATAEAALRPISIPVTIYASNAKPVTHRVTVTVQSQLGDVVVGASPSYLELYDYGAEDGDRVRIILNNRVLVSDITILHARQRIELPYVQGRNILVIQALNEGSSSPNTAGLILGNVTRGSSMQRYGLSTNETASTAITYDPNAGPSQSAAPKPIFEAGIERD